MTCWPASGSDPFSGGDVADAPRGTSPGPAPGPGFARRDVLSPLRPTDPCPAHPEPSPRGLDRARLPFGRRLGHLVRRMDPTRPHGVRAVRAATRDGSCLPCSHVGPAARDAPGPRTRARGRTAPRGHPTGPRSPRRLLAGISLDDSRRDRATAVRLLPPVPPRTGVLRGGSDPRNPGVSRVPPLLETEDPTHGVTGAPGTGRRAFIRTRHRTAGTPGPRGSG
jgi:hypothetical protein